MFRAHYPFFRRYDGIADARIKAVIAPRRIQVRGIAGQEDPTAAVAAAAPLKTGTK